MKRYPRNSDYGPPLQRRVTPRPTKITYPRSPKRTYLVRSLARRASSRDVPDDGARRGAGRQRRTAVERLEAQPASHAGARPRTARRRADRKVRLRGSRKPRGASRRSIPSHCGGRKKGHRWTRHPNATGGEALAELESKSSGRFCAAAELTSLSRLSSEPFPRKRERGRNASRGFGITEAYSGVSASRFERMVASSRSSSRSRRRRDSSVIFPSRSNS